MIRKPPSLQVQLALQLLAIFAVVTALGVGLLIWQGVQTAASFSNDTLRVRAEELAQTVGRSADGHYNLTLSSELRHRYGDPHGENLYAVRFADGSRQPAMAPFSAATASLSPKQNTPLFFQFEDFDHTGISYYGLSIRKHTPVGAVIIAVAHASDTNEVAEAIIRQFVLKVAWLIPLFAAITLAAGIMSLQRGLAPVKEVSHQAATLTPGEDGMRLITERLPRELVPLVDAFNAALGRLEKAFLVQRQFTANAAHELRTPLTVLTAGLDALPDTQAVGNLRQDVARMNRLVEQLLRVARLDAAPIVKSPVDLCQLAAQTVAFLAPWAIAQNCELSLDTPGHPVIIHGNADALSDALRNLIENAVRFTPADMDVCITVRPEGMITVEDHGPGIHPEDLPHLFERFWRGKANKPQGAGLGLSIAAGIAHQHGGRIEVENRPSGGAIFKLVLTPASIAT